MDAEEAVTCGTVLDHCIENAELTSLVTTLPQVCRELRSREAADERFMGNKELIIASDIFPCVCSYSGQVSGTTSFTGSISR